MELYHTGQFVRGPANNILAIFLNECDIITNQFMPSIDKGESKLTLADTTWAGNQYTVVIEVKQSTLNQWERFCRGGVCCGINDFSSDAIYRLSLRNWRRLEVLGLAQDL